jgi:hypothetical protein
MPENSGTTEILNYVVLDLHPVELALECRHDRVTPEEIFSEKVDLNNQFDKTISYISGR